MKPCIIFCAAGFDGLLSPIPDNALTIAACGAILFVVTELASDIFKLTGALWDKLSYVSLILCAVAAILYYITKKVKTTYAPSNS